MSCASDTMAVSHFALQKVFPVMDVSWEEPLSQNIPEYRCWRTIIVSHLRKLDCMLPYGEGWKRYFIYRKKQERKTLLPSRGQNNLLGSPSSSYFGAATNAEHLI